ncbi:MAG: carbohydrate ABC transporter permease [Oliverpabstia sp.]|nr:carbohydrate ABC transporter permease [Oliverpabstia sp.]
MKKKNSSKGKFLRSDRVFDVVNVLFMVVMLIIFVWPLWFVVIASVSDPNEIWNGNVLLIPKGFTMVAYEALADYSMIWTGYRNTIIYTVVGTLVNLVMTVCAAYPLSRKDFMPRNFFMVMFMITMYFGGGLIPTYLVVSNLNLINTPWAMIIPGACSIYNVIIMRTYFINSIPHSLQEAAELDGANAFQFLMKVVLPLSKPIIAVVALYYAVGHWNDFYTALLYINDQDLLPLQSFLRDILMSNKMSLNNMQGLDAAAAEAKMQLSQTLKYSVIIISTVPVLCVYPFIQKYFVKGIMIGSVKG